MRHLLTAVTLMLLLCYSAEAQEKSDREKANLLGPVRSVRLETVDYRDAALKVSLGTREREFVTYDQKGNEIERVTNLLDLVGKEVRTYDSNGKLIEIAVFNSEGLHERQVHAYKNGKLLQIISYDANGKVILTEVNSYDKDGRLLETNYVSEKKSFGKTLYKHDDKGNLLEVAYFQGGAKSIALVGPCRGAHRITYSYDEQRQPTKIVHFEPDGKVKETFQYSYDNKGLVTAHYLEYYEAKQTFAYSYEFDSHGNWTRKLTTKDLGNKDFPDASKAVSVTSREISYY